MCVSVSSLGRAASGDSKSPGLRRRLLLSSPLHFASLPLPPSSSVGPHSDCEWCRVGFFLSFCRCSFALRKSFIVEGRESVLLADCSLASRLPATDSIKERIPHLISDVLYIWPNDAPIFCLFTANSILLPPPPFNLPGFCGGAAIFGQSDAYPWAIRF